MAKITIDELARMMNNAFEHFKEFFSVKIDKLEERIDNLEVKMDKGFASVDKQFVEVDIRLDRLENNHERRITLLEDDVRVLKTKAQG
jgi:SMC interacting uncharacterized protein involved in chromosome segregation